MDVVTREYKCDKYKNLLENVIFYVKMKDNSKNVSSKII